MYIYTYILIFICIIYSHVPLTLHILHIISPTRVAMVLAKQ